MVVSSLVDIYAKYESIEKTQEWFDKMKNANKKSSSSPASYYFDSITDTLYISYNIKYLILKTSIYNTMCDVIIDAMHDILFNSMLSIN